MVMTALPSEVAAVVATIDPDNYASGAQSSDYVDMHDFEAVMFILMVGDWPDTDHQIDFKLQEATSSGGAGAQDLSGFAATTLDSDSPASPNKQIIINIRREDLTVDSSYRFVKAVATAGDVTSGDSGNLDYAVVAIGFGPRHGPASNFDLASVVEIV